MKDVNDTKPMPSFLIGEYPDGEIDDPILGAMKSDDVLPLILRGGDLANCEPIGDLSKILFSIAMEYKEAFIGSDRKSFFKSFYGDDEALQQAILRIGGLVISAQHYPDLNYRVAQNIRDATADYFRPDMLNALFSLGDSGRANATSNNELFLAFLISRANAQGKKTGIGEAVDAEDPTLNVVLPKSDGQPFGVRTSFVVYGDQARSNTYVTAENIELSDAMIRACDAGCEKIAFLGSDLNHNSIVASQVVLEGFVIDGFNEREGRRKRGGLSVVQFDFGSMDNLKAVISSAEAEGW